MKAVEAGADVIDTAMSPLAMGTSQPATEVMVETFKGTPYDTGLDHEACWERSLTTSVRFSEEALKIWPASTRRLLGVNIKTLDVSGTGRYAFQPGKPVKGSRC